MNATTRDTTLNADIKSVYTKPSWVTTENMNDTIIKDGWLKPSALCAGKLASACKDAGIQ